MTSGADDRPIDQWRILWLDSLWQLGSLELQRATWLNSENGNPHWSFVEFCESYFEQFDLRNGYAYAIRNGIVSKAEAEAVREFHEALARYQAPGGDDFAHVAILEDPKWHAVVELAASAAERVLGLSFNAGYRKSSDG
jgi:hypothetical protein